MHSRCHLQHLRKICRIGTSHRYSGGEDNISWRRTATTIDAAGATRPAIGDVAMRGREAIHSVATPISNMTYAI